MTISLRSKGFILILSSPSGGGKSSLAKRLLELCPNLKLSISVTTRTPRQGEVNGKDYYFKDITEFNQLIQQNKLLEYAKIYNNYYGTLLAPVEEALERGIDVLFDIDWQGARSISRIMPQKTVSIFILPPSFDTLKQRLQNRGEDSQEQIKLRLQSAYEEITHVTEYDYVVVNDQFDDAINQLKSIFLAEHAKTSRLDKLSNFLS